MLLKDNEEKRNIAWRTVMTVTSVLIILIVVFFAVKLFTSNPLTGNWENTDDGMKLTIKNNGTMNIVQTLDESTVSVPVDYTIDMEYKRFAIHVNEEKIAKQAEKTKRLFPAGASGYCGCDGRNLRIQRGTERTDTD